MGSNGAGILVHLEIMSGAAAVLLLTNSGASWTVGHSADDEPPTVRQAPEREPFPFGSTFVRRARAGCRRAGEVDVPQRLAARRLLNSDQGTTLSCLPQLDHSLLRHPHTFAGECNFCATNSREITAALMRNRPAISPRASKSSTSRDQNRNGVLNGLLASTLATLSRRCRARRLLLVNGKCRWNLRPARL